jgi:hypothetical protein
MGYPVQQTAWHLHVLVLSSAGTNQQASKQASKQASNKQNMALAFF